LLVAGVDGRPTDTVIPLIVSIRSFKARLTAPIARDVSANAIVSSSRLCTKIGHHRYRGVFAPEEQYVYSPRSLIDPAPLGVACKPQRAKAHGAPLERKGIAVVRL
jgi:hypothetical protein